MKKIYSLIAVGVLALALTGCGKNNDSPSLSKFDGNANKTESSNESNENSESAAVGEDGTPVNSEEEAENIPVNANLGKLNFIGDASVLRGVSLAGVCAGSEDYNSKPAGTENIRSIFEMNEWVKFYLDASVEEGIQVWLMKNRKDQDSYKTETISESSKGYVKHCQLSHGEYSEVDYWGITYLDSELDKKGYYDLVFTYEDKTIATMLVKFYETGSLQDKTDEELDEMVTNHWKN